MQTISSISSKSSFWYFLFWVLILGANEMVLLMLHVLHVLTVYLDVLGWNGIYWKAEAHIWLDYWHFCRKCSTAWRNIATEDEAFKSQHQQIRKAYSFVIIKCMVCRRGMIYNDMEIFQFDCCTTIDKILSVVVVFFTSYRPILFIFQAASNGIPECGGCWHGWAYLSVFRLACFIR